MTTLEKAAFGEGFVPVPKHVKTGRDGTMYFECPFCGKNAGHYAVVRPAKYLMDARPIHCFETGRHAWVDLLIPSILAQEDEAFRSLLSSHDLTPMTASQAAEAWHSRGLPYEIAEELADDAAEFVRLASEHRAKGGNAFKEVYG